MTSDGDSYSPRIGLSIALLSGAAMTTELVLTRIFSVVLWYHFAFFAISVALFGTGAAAVLVQLAQKRLERFSTPNLVGAGCLGLGITILVVDLVLLNATPNWFGAQSDNAFTQLTGRLVALFGLAAAPFFFAGFVLSVVMRRLSQASHQLYFWDLLGAGLACVSVVLLLSWLGGPRALLAGAVLAAAAGVLAKPRRGLQVTGAVTVVAALLLGTVGSDLLRVRVAKGIDLQRTPAEFQRWNSFSMVTVLPERQFRGWGSSPTYKGALPEQKRLIIDMNAMTALTRFDGDFDEVRHVDYDMSALVHRIRPRSSHVCVIGAGGGKDVLAALSAGARRVTAVEINPLIVEDVVRGRYREFTGGLYHRDDVQAVVADGRSYVQRSGDRYDVLQLSMVDTSAATAAGAYSLTENSLYTVEAFEEFLGSLAPKGVLTVASSSLPNLAVGARLTSIARESVLRLGGDPANSIAVVQGQWLGSAFPIYNVLVSPDGFSEGDVDRLAAAADELRFTKVYLPRRKLPLGPLEHQAIVRIATAKDGPALAREMDSWPLDVSASTDNRPFFFYQNRLSQFVPAATAATPGHLFGNGLVILSKITLVAVVVVLLFIILPMWLGPRADGESSAGGSRSADLAYVACLGAGFMLVELGLLQHLTLYLGNPTATLGVVIFMLLVTGGVGSRIFARGDSKLPKRARLAMLGVIGYGTLLVAIAGPLFEATRAWDTLGRTLVAAVLIAPLGLLLGVPFPAALRRVGDRAPSRIPWLWAINSAMSVLGTVVAILIALHAGINATLLTGVALYVGALGLSRVVLRDASAPQVEVSETVAPASDAAPHE